VQYYRPGDEVAPGHLLVKFLGRGGFGEVWKATGPGGVEVAIKVVNLAGDQGFKEFRAIRLLRKLRHPNLVPLFGFWLKDEDNNLIDDSATDNSLNMQGIATEMVIAMGLGEKSLLDRLKECKKAKVRGIPTLELLDYVEDAARAIDYLNEPCHDLGQGHVGIQHCDIKPANILIVGNAAQVCDFGLARVLSGQARSTTGAALTPAYVAPEMIENKPCRATDQYSLAITYYELRTGSLPFSASDPSTAMQAHLKGNLDFSLLPAGEQRVLRRAAALKPEERYPTTVAMVENLRRAIAEGNRPSSKAEVNLTGVSSGQEVVPGFKLVRKIGEGGYGEVWEARAPGNVQCALKVIRNLDASQNVQEFRVLEVMKALEHEHLMGLQAYWLVDPEGNVLPDDLESEPVRAGATMLVIQTQLAAKNLAQRLKECQRAGQPGIPPQELLGYMRQAASATDYLNTPQHLLGDRVLSIQHRDIKPENILLTRQGNVKISDFGLAKMVEGTSATIHSKSRGLTAAYAAPEMFKGNVTRWTDQYCLAISYYRLRTGRLPFDPNQPLYTMMLVHTEGRLDFGLLGQAEQSVLHRATELDPEKRYTTCAEMVRALEAAVWSLEAPPETAPRDHEAMSGPLPSALPEPTRDLSKPPGTPSQPPPTAQPTRSSGEQPPVPVRDLTPSQQGELPPVRQTGRRSPGRELPSQLDMHFTDSGPLPFTPGERTSEGIEHTLVPRDGDSGPPVELPSGQTAPRTTGRSEGGSGFGSGPDAQSQTAVSEPGTKVRSGPPAWKESSGNHRPLRESSKKRLRAPRLTPRARKIMLIMGICALLMSSGWFVLSRLMRPESLPEFEERIRVMMREERYLDALQAIRTAPQPDEAKAALRNEMKFNLFARAKDRIETRKDIGEVVHEMQEWLQAVPHDEDAEKLWLQAGNIQVTDQVDELLASQKYAEAYDHPGTTDFKGAEWVDELRQTVLRAWLKVAQKSLDDRDFEQAKKVAAEITLKDSAFTGARTITEKADQQTKEIVGRVDGLIKEHKFDDACGVIEKEWPRGEAERQRVIDSWLDWADELRGKSPDKAETEIDGILKKKPGYAKALALRTGIARDRLLGEIKGLMAKGDYPKAADRLEADGSKLEADQKPLRGELENVWLAAVKAKPTFEEKIKGYEEVERVLKSQEAHNRLVALRNMATIEEKIGSEFRLTRLEKTQIADLRKKMKDLRQETGSASLHKRIDALVAMLDKAEVAVADPLGSNFDAFKKGLEGKDLTRIDRENLDDVYALLLNERVRKRITSAGEKPPDWRALLEDCRSAPEAKGTWLLAGRVEALVATNEARGADWEKARKTLADITPVKEAAGYVAYVKALAAFEDREFDQAATLLADGIRTEGVSAELQAPRRQEQALGRIFRSPIVNLRKNKNATLSQPFGSPAEAARAFGWLEQAASLPASQKDPALLTNLALAAWSMKPGNPARAAALAATLLKEQQLVDYVRGTDIYLLALIDARQHSQMPASHALALAGYERALLQTSQVLHDPSDSKPLVQHVYESLIAKLAKDGGKGLLSGEVDPKLKGQRAQLCARAARLIRSDPFTWAQVEVTEAGEKKNLKPLQEVVDLYGQAVGLDQKAEYLVRKAFAQAEIAVPDPAKLQQIAGRAIEMDSGYGGGYALKGMALLLESRTQSDYADRIKRLTEAKAGLEKAVELSKAAASEELSDFYRQWSSITLELGNYVSEDKNREANLTLAEEYADKATKLNPRNLDAWDALAYAREDIASIPGRKERFKDAVDAYTRAIEISFLEARPRPWLGRGRCRYKWASSGGQEKNLLNDADQDLLEVLRRDRNSLEAAESNYWLACIALLQRRHADPDNVALKDRLLEDALRYFQGGLTAAQNQKSLVWEEATLQAWADLALAEAQVRKPSDRPSRAACLDQAEEKATLLGKKYNQAESALIRGQVALFRAIDKDNKEKAEARKTAIRLFDEGIEDKRSQDWSSLLNLRIALAQARLVAIPQDLEGARKDADAARKLVDKHKSGVNPNIRAEAIGVRGTVLYLQSATANDLAAEAREEFRTALKEAPNHPSSWLWCELLSYLLDRKDPRSPAEERELKERIAEAKRKFPNTRDVAGYEAGLMSLYKKYHPESP
jgi:serine/threonine protein kinase